MKFLITAFVAGVLLGALDLLAQTTLPYPWANLANSGAVWALAAFALGMYGGQCRGPRAGAGGGVILLVTAVESYYVAAVILRDDSPSTLWNATARLWLILAVLVGAAFSAAGTLTRSPRPGVRGAVAVFAGSIFVLEAGHILTRRSAGHLSTDDLETALVEFGLAVVVGIVVFVLSRRSRPLARPGAYRARVLIRR